MRPTVVTAALLLLLTVPTSSVRPLPSPTRVARHVPSPALGRRRALAGAAALGAALATTQPANAAYAPSLASLSSSAPLKDISVDEWLKLTPKKRLQRGAVISRDRARELGREFDKQTYNVERDAIEGLIKEVETEIKALEARGKQGEAVPTLVPQALLKKLEGLKESIESSNQAKAVQQQLEDRERLLSRLDAQPQWVVYGAALLGSIASTLVMHPVDTIKTRLQSGQDTEVELPSGAADLKELYVGIGPNLVKEAPPSAVYLGVYEAVKTRLLASGKVPALAAYLASGAAGELVGSILRAPSEAAKTRVQSGAAEGAAAAAAQVLFDAEGRANTARAWTASLLRDVPMGAIQIAVFELLKSAIVQSPGIDLDVSSVQAEAGLGAIGGLLGALATAPADVLTTRIISGDEGLGPKEVAERILDEEGVEGFANGIKERALYWTPAIGIFLACYCSLRQLALGVLDL